MPLGSFRLNTLSKKELTAQVSYWLNKIFIATSPTNDQKVFIQSSALDTNTNDVVCLYRFGNNSYGIAKFSSLGQLIWSKNFPVNSLNFFHTDIVVDSNSNIYIAGTHFGVTPAVPVLTKISSAGSVVFQRGYVIGSTTLEAGFYNLTIDSSNNLYCVGYYNIGTSSTRRPLVIIKTNSDGTVSLARSLTTTENAYQFDHRTIEIDSSGQIITGGFYNNISFNIKNVNYSKFNSSGTVIVSNNVGTGSNNNLEKIKTDNDGNFYIMSTRLNTNISRYQAVLQKLNVSNTVLWSRIIGATAQNNYARSLAISNDNSLVYALTLQGDTQTSGGWLSAYNTSGTLQWQRLISRPLANRFVYPRIYTAGSAIQFVIQPDFLTPIVGDSYLMQVPNDGTKTGTYDNIQYQSVNLTQSSETVNQFNQAVTSSTVTTSIVNYSLAFTDTVLQQNIFNI
jgi:hypothetical protein